MLPEGAPATGVGLCGAAQDHKPIFFVSLQGLRVDLFRGHFGKLHRVPDDGYNPDSEFTNTYAHRNRISRTHPPALP